MSEQNLVQAMRSERDIRDRLHLYCRAVNELDLDLLPTLWHSDGTLDCEEPALRGAIADLAPRLLNWFRAWGTQNHQITNAIIEVDGDRAVSETYTFDVLRAAGVAGVLDSHRRGRYLDRWSRREGRWALEHRQYVCSYQWSQSVLPVAAVGAEAS